MLLIIPPIRVIFKLAEAFTFTSRVFFHTSPAHLYARVFYFKEDSKKYAAEIVLLRLHIRFLSAITIQQITQPTEYAALFFAVRSAVR